MEGKLQKWANYLYGYNERYFVLKNNILYYYLQKRGKPKGRIHLSVASINATEEDVKFEIDCGLSIIYLKAESKEKKDEWVKALKIAKLEGDNKSSLMNNLNSNNNKISGNINVGNNTEDRLVKRLGGMRKSLNELQKTNDIFQSYIDNNYSYIDEVLNKILDSYKVNKLFYLF
jgi:collagen type IV alpha-3-binding protein